jgi:hypothetical protein
MKILSWRGPRGTRFTLSLDRWLDRAGYLTTMETGIHAPSHPFTGGCGCCPETGSTAATTITTETEPEPSGPYTKPYLLPPLPANVISFPTSTPED